MSHAWFAIAFLSIGLMLLASLVRKLGEEVQDLRRSLNVVTDVLQKSIERELERTK